MSRFTKFKLKQNIFTVNISGYTVVNLQVNIGFLVMAIIKLKKHRKNSKHPVRYWVKAIVSLTIVMGVAWLFGVLFFHEKLLFVAYIMAIFIAGQGIILFLLLVPLSKQVCRHY